MLAIVIALLRSRVFNLVSQVLVGSPVLMASHNIDLPPVVLRAMNGLKAGGKVALLAAFGGRIRAIIGVADMVRGESAAVVESLRRRGVVTYMITGDAQSTAFAIGSVVGIPRDRIFAGTKPKDKEAIVNALVNKHGRKVAFVGDGTNDSPALARASVGIAMSSGSSIAIESGDMVLCKDDLQSVVTALDLSVKTMRRIKINYIWALVYNACLVPIAAGIFVPAFGFKLAPTMAGMAMAASSVSIVVSSLLLQLYTPPASLVAVSKTFTTASDDDKAPLSPSRHGLLDESPATSPRGRHPRQVHFEEDVLEQCMCPVSTAPAFELVEPTRLEQMLEQLNDWASQLIDRVTAKTEDDRRSRAVYSPITNHSSHGISEVPGSHSTRDDDDEVNNDLYQRVELSLSSPRHKLSRKSVEASRSMMASSCSCGKNNCKCGSDCQCGKVLKH